MDMLDYTKNYAWADLGIKTKRLEADEIAWDIHATAWSIGATELATNAVETVKIKDWNVTYVKLWTWVLAWEQVADTVALETDKYLSLTINWTTYKVWIVA